MAHPTNRKWLITRVIYIGFLERVNPHIKLGFCTFFYIIWEIYVIFIWNILVENILVRNMGYGRFHVHEIYNMFF